MTAASTVMELCVLLSTLVGILRATNCHQLGIDRLSTDTGDGGLYIRASADTGLMIGMYLCTLPCVTLLELDLTP